MRTISKWFVAITATMVVVGGQSANAFGKLTWPSHSTRSGLLRGPLTTDH